MLTHPNRPLFFRCCIEVIDTGVAHTAACGTMVGIENKSRQQCLLIRPIRITTNHVKQGGFMSAQPIEYFLEVYENSFINDPVWSVEAKTPFPTLSIGDRFDQRALTNVAWDREANDDQEYRVIDIDHIFWNVGGKLGHKLMVKLALTRRTQDF
jgi:hypothetical protein